MHFNRNALLATVSASAVLLSSAAYSLPQVGVVAAGNATISGSGLLAMVTQGSDRAVIDWQSFDVGAGEAVTFRQPSASSMTLNRIHDQKPSEIFGRISANGQVILTNPNGMLFGRDSRIDVAGLVATSASGGTDVFMQGGQNVKLTLDQAGRPGAKIINRGTITAKEAGLVALVAPAVENSGTISARLGLVQLAGAETATVDLFGDGLVAVAVTGNAMSTSVTSSGRITAGRIALTAADAAHLVESVVNTTGMLEASNARIEKNGTVVFGGKIVLTARDVTIGQGAQIHADGGNGGGIIKLGGGWQGRGTIPNARNTIIARGATITANASEKGNGGTIVAWSDQATRFGGTIDARGGPKGGNGGHVETSGKERLGVTGTVNASAPKGIAGDWLLDPRNVTISGAGAYSVNPAGETVDPGSDNFTILASSISTALSNGNNVTITTGTTGVQTGNITLSTATIAKTGGGDATLTLKADGSITTAGVNAITSTAGKLHTILWSDAEAVPNSDGYISLVTTTITTNGGDFIAAGGLDNGANGGTAADGRPDNFAWGNATVVNGVTLNNAAISSGAGNIMLRGHGRNNAAVASQVGVYALGGSVVQTSGEGAITVLGTGGSGTNTNYGVYLTGAGTLLGVVDGDIAMSGAGAGTGSSGSGAVVYNGATIRSTGTGASAGNISLTGIGSANGTGSNFGVRVESAGLATAITTVDGDINLSGLGGGNGTNVNNYGVLINTDADILSTGVGASAGNITLNGTGGNGTTGNAGTYLNGSGTTLTTIDGDVLLIGQGGTGTSSNHGILLGAGARAASTGVGASAGNITLNGTGGNGTLANYGIYLSVANTAITTVDGDISLTGQAGNSSVGGQADGLYLFDGSRILSTGVGASAGNITLTGVAGTGTAGNYGLLIQGPTLATNVQSTDGLITLTGTGVAGTSSNAGILLTGAFAAVSSINGDIALTGQGGNGSSTSNLGIYMLAGADIISTGTGADAANITLNGTAGISSQFGYGIYMTNSGTSITAVDGDISLTGQGGTGTTGGFGVGTYLNDGITVATTGTGASAGNISITGQGDNTLASNYGVYIQGTAAATLVQTADGNITLTGTGGSGTASNYGVVATGSLATITSLNGDITATAVGGNGSGANNYGFYMTAGADITSTGLGANAGNINLTGTGGSGTTTNYGVRGDTAGTTITTVDGDISLTGTGGNGTDQNYGVLWTTSALIASTGTGAGAGNIAITGTASGLGTRYGSYIYGTVTSADGDISIYGSGATRSLPLDTGAILTASGDGNISLYGTSPSGGNTASDIFLRNAVVGLAGGSGTITLTGNTSSFATSTVTTGGDITFKPRTAGTSIGVAGGAGTLQLDATGLAMFAAGHDFTIGDAASGLITVDPYAAWSSQASSAVHVLSGSGGVTFASGAHDFGTRALSVTTAGPLTVNGAITAGSALLQTTGATSDLTIGAAGGIIASTTGDAITLATGRNFINQRGTAALSAAVGRWLVYSGDPWQDTTGGLGYNFQQFSCTYGGVCGPVSTSGNVLLYRYTPPVLTGGSGAGNLPTPPVTPSTPPSPPAGEPGGGQPATPPSPVSTARLLDFIRNQDRAVRTQVEAPPYRDAIGSGAGSTAFGLLLNERNIEDEVPPSATGEDADTRVRSDDRKRRSPGWPLYTLSRALSRNLESDEPLSAEGPYGQQ